MGQNHPDIEILKIVLQVEGDEPKEIQVLGNPAIHFDIPEGSEYFMTLHFTVANNTLKELKYKQEIKKAGFVVKSREVYVGDEFAPREEPYAVDFAKDTTPTGFMFRGNFNCTSTYTESGEFMFAQDWTLTVSKKK